MVEPATILQENAYVVLDTMGHTVNFPAQMDYMESTVLLRASAKMEQTVHSLMVHAVALLDGLENYVMIHVHLAHMG
jgi:hypothetical protein